MSEKYKSERSTYCIICGEIIRKGDEVEWTKLKRGPQIFAHAECYAKEKDKRGSKA